MTEGSIAKLVAAGTLPGRVWFSNYHCNLRCAHCLTESAPSSDRRQLDAARIAVFRPPSRRVGLHRARCHGR